MNTLRHICFRVTAIAVTASGLLFSANAQADHNEIYRSLAPALIYNVLLQSQRHDRPAHLYRPDRHEQYDRPRENHKKSRSNGHHRHHQKPHKSRVQRHSHSHGQYIGQRMDQRHSRF